MKKTLAGLLVFTLICPQLWAQAGPDPKHVEKIKKQVADCVDKQRRVTVETYDDRRLQGFVSEAGADTFVLTYGSSSTTLGYTNIHKIKWTSEFSKQAKVVLGAVAVTGVIVGLLVLFGGLRG